MGTELTRDRVLQVLLYHPDTGEFRHAAARRGVRVGELAGTINHTDGLRYIGIDGKKYAAQRLAWYLVKGEWPEHEVGFLDGNLESPMRERFDNLAMTVVGELTAVELRQIFNYDPVTGHLTYRTPRRGVTVGKRAGSVDTNGYRYIGVRGQFFTAQRLSWAHYHGEWPDGDVRFKNGNKDDCGISNLYRPLGEYAIPDLRNAKNRADRKENPEKYRKYDLRKNGFDPDQVDILLAAQGGVCACCGQPETAVRGGKTKNLATDHDHVTGVVRGVLCNRCNVAIGMMDDDPDRLIAAAEYVRRGGVALGPEHPICGVCHKLTDSAVLAVSGKGEIMGRLCDTCRQHAAPECAA